MREGLSPQEKIRKKIDFLNIYKKGNCYRGKYFNLIYLPNSLAFSRIAVVASKKIGNAVKRNRIRRIFKDLFRRNKDLLTTPVDIVIITKKEIQNAALKKVRDYYFLAIQTICLKK